MATHKPVPHHLREPRSDESTGRDDQAGAGMSGDELYAWQDEAGYLHVCGTHDVDRARLVLLDYIACAGVDLSTADLLQVATTTPTCWWAYPLELPGGDVEYPSVPADTADAVPMVTWPGDDLGVTA